MKKTVSILIVLTLLVNIAGFGFLNLKAAAEVLSAGVAAILGVIQGGLQGAAATTASAIINNSSPDDPVSGFAGFYSFHSKRREIEYAEDTGALDGFIGINVENGIAVFFVDPNCAADQVGFANSLVNRLNNIAPRYRVVNDKGEIESSLYESIKSITVDEYYKYLARNDYIKSMALMANQGLLPKYEFDWKTGGIPIDLPSQTSYTSIERSGMKFAAPLTMGENFDQYYTSLCTTKPYADGTLDFSYNGNKYSDNQYSIVYNARNKAGYYGFGAYYIVNGVMYKKVTNYNEPNKLSGISRDYVGDTTWYINDKGDKLSDIMPAWQVSGALWGIFVLTEPYNESANVFPAITEFEETTGGGTIEAPPLSDEELAIIQAIAAGLLPEDFMLKFDELGKIIAANNIPIETLKNLLQQIKDGQMKFENFESYLAAISAMLKAGNVDRQTSNAILANIAALQEKTNGDINVLNTAISGLKELDQERNDTLARIEANTAAIAEAITAGTIISAGTEFDVRTPSIITDKFPFSLPFDIYHIYNLLSAEPQAPHWEIPIEMEGVYEYSIDIDLSEYDWIANIVRWLMYAVFIVGLIIVTNKLIGRG